MPSEFFPDREEMPDPPKAKDKPRPEPGGRWVPQQGDDPKPKHGRGYDLVEKYEYPDARQFAPPKEKKLPDPSILGKPGQGTKRDTLTPEEEIEFERILRGT
jgi:hypothetical protein